MDKLKTKLRTQIKRETRQHFGSWKSLKGTNRLFPTTNYEREMLPQKIKKMSKNSTSEQLC